MTRLAVFDCDGTLVDGQAAICETMEDAFAAAGLAAPSRQHIRRVVGLSLPQAMAILAPGAGAEGHDRLVGAYKDSFRARRIAGRLDEPLYEGIAELIVRLADDGWQLGIATGKSFHFFNRNEIKVTVYCMFQCRSCNSKFQRFTLIWFCQQTVDDTSGE